MIFKNFEEFKSHPNYDEGYGFIIWGYSGNYCNYEKRNTIVPHREDGPAIIYDDGDETWWLNGERHRLDGPANMMTEIGKETKYEYWYKGIEIQADTLEEFHKKIKVLSIS